MGKKINPKIFRIKQNRDWESRWFALKNYSKFLKQDIEIKRYIEKKLEGAFVSHVEIERTAKALNIMIYAARPGVIIGRGGAGIEALKKDISRKILKYNKKLKLNINIKEVSNPNLDASIIAEYIKLDIEKRIPFRRAIKQALGKAEKAGAKGVKIMVAGRLNGAEIARSEKLLSGKLPLQTFRADMDYAFKEAHTIYGLISIKVWIYKGEVFDKKEKKENNKKVQDK
ncbi:MAG TPA: 30S ribosomal protein S3 [Patescibacteria group bacterium]|nr:30S ribosomal protein S3 [Patescibacteria group bacterium]